MLSMHSRMVMAGHMGRLFTAQICMLTEAIKMDTDDRARPMPTVLRVLLFTAIYTSFEYSAASACDFSARRRGMNESASAMATPDSTARMPRPVRSVMVS